MVHLRGSKGVNRGRAHTPSGISHCSSVAGFACSPHLFSRWGCHGDMPFAVLLMGVIGLYCTHTETHTCTHQGLKIEGWPVQPCSLNIDPYLMMPLRRNERGQRFWELDRAFILEKGVLMLTYHFSLISLIRHQSSGCFLKCKFLHHFVFWKRVVHPQRRQVFHQEVTLLKPRIKPRH